MKKLVIVLVVLLCALQSNAQALRSSTLIETSPYAFSTGENEPGYLDRTSMDQTIYWRQKFNAESQAKTIYHLQSIFKRDSMIGVRLYGMDIDMMSDAFEKKGANRFRYWNKLRLGFTLILEKNRHRPDYPLEEFYNYLDGEFYIHYLHLSQSTRGDRTTRFRRGSFAIFLLATPSRRIDAYVKVNVGGVWLKPYYFQEYGIPRVGFCAEWETNPKGYSKTKCHSSKDLYRGVTLIGGTEMNLDTRQISLRLGVKLDMRNH